MNLEQAALCEKLEKTLGNLILGEGKLFEAARYSIFTGGKRSRPLITLFSALDLGGKTEEALIPAACLEMVHTYSLIHDDLPCMDDDDYRRGKPTLHKVTDESTAVLTGDYLLTRAFECLAQYVPSQTALSYIRILSDAAGGEGMIGGQVLDLSYENQTIQFTQLKEMHLLKTGRLIQAALQFGGIAAEASDAVLEQLHDLGAHLGLAVQILNDLEDIDEGVLSDQQKGKATYVSLLGYEGAQEAYSQEIEKANSLMEQIPLTGGRLRAFLTQVYPALQHSCTR
ncbi:MAG: polyprenyl synthetase family protein [Chlamydiia bacterium]|nr:polyprenyl synthetase family protein [Chlamydiia bacterium]